MTRVAFTVFGGDGWTGGLNYLRNLISALAELPGQPVEPVLFVAPETPALELAELRAHLAQPPVVVPGWARDGTTRARRLWHSAVLQDDRISQAAFAQQRIDVVFVHAAWYGLRFALPTLAWIADFQHRHLPHMFGATQRWRRDLGYEALSRCANTVMLSSRDAQQDCVRFYPRTRGRTWVLPFAVRLDPQALQDDAAGVARRHGLPERFFYMPNQLWKHKNHLALLHALHLLRQRSVPVVVVASGNPSDSRNPEHPQQVLDTAQQLGLKEAFRFLGLIPYADLMALMRASLAVVNPSLFEGWSTPVEEAKALGVPLLLSDLAVHREQTAGCDTLYFDPHSPAAMAEVLAQAWARPGGDRAAREAAAVQGNLSDRLRFAQAFADKVATLAGR